MDPRLPRAWYLLVSVIEAELLMPPPPPPVQRYSVDQARSMLRDARIAELR